MQKKEIQETAVIVVDVQGDFTTHKNGSLAVAGTGIDYLELVSSATKKMKAMGYPVFATQDWHPVDHISFYTNTPGKSAYETIEINNRSQILWPPLCVQASENAKILVDNNLFDAIVKKGMNPGYDSYSGFFDDGGHPTGLGNILKSRGITGVIIYGLTTDYCAKATALDALALGFKVSLVESLCRGVETDTTRAALDEMLAAGVCILPVI